MNFEPDAMISIQNCKDRILISENPLCEKENLFCGKKHQKSRNPKAAAHLLQSPSDYLLNRSLIPPSEPSTLDASYGR